MATPDDFVDLVCKLVTPNQVKRITGSAEEYGELCQTLVETGCFTKLNPKLWPNSFSCRTSPDDATRDDSSVFVCTDSEEQVPSGNWAKTDEMQKRVDSAFNGCMKGRCKHFSSFCFC